MRESSVLIVWQQSAKQLSTTPPNSINHGKLWQCPCRTWESCSTGTEPYVLLYSTGISKPKPVFLYQDTRSSRLINVIWVVVAFSLLARILGKCSTIHYLPALYVYMGGVCVCVCVCMCVYVCVLVCVCVRVRIHKWMNKPYFRRGERERES